MGSITLSDIIWSDFKWANISLGGHKSGRTLVWALASGEIVNNFEENLKSLLLFDDLS